MNLNPFNAIERKAKNFDTAADAIAAQLLILDQSDVPLVDQYAEDCQTKAEACLEEAKVLNRTAFNTESSAVVLSGFGLGFLIVSSLMGNIDPIRGGVGALITMLGTILFMRSGTLTAKQQESLNEANKNLFAATNSLRAIRVVENPAVVEERLNL